MEFFFVYFGYTLKLAELECLYFYSYKRHHTCYVLLTLVTHTCTKLFIMEAILFQVICLYLDHLKHSQLNCTQYLIATVADQHSWT